MPNKFLKTYDEYVEESVNESNFLLVSKRKRGESQAQYVSTKAPLRKKVLEFIDSKKIVSEEDLKEFLSSVSEDIGFSPSPNWLKHNKQYVEAKREKGELVGYRLTEMGKRVLNTMKKYDTLREEIKKEILDGMSGKRARINDKIHFDNMLTGKSRKKINENELLNDNISDDEINEARVATHYMNTNVTMRNSILEFLSGKKEASLDDIKKFFTSLKESIGKSPSISYLSNNKHLIERKVNSNGTSTYKLTPLGEKVLAKSKMLE
jgi:DNA-binding PadR family transcriptional regulator